jgi:plasmid segregation protein ParM
MESQMESGKRLFVAGYDGGYSNAKLTYGWNDEGTITTEIYPATGFREETSTFLKRNNRDEVIVHVDGEKWSVFGPGKSQEREINSGYTQTSIYKALYLGALEKMSKVTKKIDILVTGLPASQARNPAVVKPLIALMEGVHKVNEDTEVVVHKVMVIAQGSGVINDVLNSIDDPDRLFRSNILVVDPGYYSVDYVVYEKGNMNARASNSSVEAVRSLITKINELMRDEIKTEPGLDTIEEAFRAGEMKIYMFGKEYELVPYVEKAKKLVCPRLLSQVRNDLSYMENGRVDEILLAGGGAKFYEDAVREAYPNARINVSEEPVASNSRGFFYYGLGEVES